MSDISGSHKQRPHSAPTRFWPSSTPPTAERGRRRNITLVLIAGAGVATVAYLLWRMLFTLDASSALLGIPLLVIEIWSFVSAIMFTMMLWDLGAIAPAEKRLKTDITTTILIPTYNEPPEVLLPTLTAAAKVRLVKNVWVLDDGRRDWVRAACEQLGLTYRTRDNNDHAKAGNINAALPDVDTDVILVLDADHVPAQDFVVRTIGYFEDPEVAIVQTPQDFYNIEASFEHEAEGDRLFSEQELFYRMLETGRNRWNAAFWCGTGALVRVEALRGVGGVATDSITEDILTSIRMHRQGWKSVHHNEVLARGLAAVSADQYLSQRQRWGSGAMQTLRTEKFLTGKGLTFPQRVSYIATLTGWFESWATFILLLLPAATLITGGTPISAPLAVFVIVFGITFVLQKIALARLTQGRSPWWHSTVFSVIRLPATLTATFAIWTSKPMKFHVTHKGKIEGERTRNRISPLHLFILIVLLGSFLWGAAVLMGLTPVQYATPWIAWFAMGWLLINLVLVIAAVRRVSASRFASERRSSTRVPVIGRVTCQGRTADLVDLSLGGAAVVAAECPEVGRQVQLHFSDEEGREVELMGEVRRTQPQDRGCLVQLQFDAESQMAMAAILAPVLSKSD